VFFELMEGMMIYIKEHPIRTGVWVVLLGLFLYLWVRHGTQIKNFLIEVKIELGKCNWPVDPKEKGMAKYQSLINSTTVIIVAGLIVSLVIVAVDFVFHGWISWMIDKVKI